MKKNQIRLYVVLVILCIVFCVIAFAPPFKMTAVFWTGFSAGIVSLAAQILFFRHAFSPEGDAKSRFYRFPIARIGVVYGIVQWILSILEMAFAALLPAWIAVLVDAVVLALALLGGIAAVAVRDEVERQDTVIKKDVSVMRSLQSLANSIAAQCTDDSMRKELQAIAEELRYSDPVSSDAAAALETEMLRQLQTIQRTVQSAEANQDTATIVELTKQLRAHLTERNQICKLNK